MSDSDHDNSLLPFERAVLDMVFSVDCACAVPLREQLCDCVVSRREYSGVGFFTDILPNPSAPPIANTGRIWFGGVYAEVEGVKHGAGFVVLIDNGYIDMLEGYTYDDPWPDQVTGFTLSYVDPAEKHCADLEKELRISPRV